MASLDEKLAEIAATEARLAARERGEELSAAVYVPTEAEIRRSIELAQKFPDWKTFVATVEDAPQRTATTSRARPAGRRTRRVAASRDGPSSDGDPEPLAPRRRSLTAAERRVLKLLIDTRRREIIAAGIQLTDADRALFADDVAEQQGVR
jgi:hypothetical protein